MHQDNLKEISILEQKSALQILVQLLEYGGTMQISFLEQSVDGGQSAVETAIRKLSSIKIVQDYQMYERGPRYIMLTDKGESIAYDLISIQEKINQEYPDEKDGKDKIDLVVQLSEKQRKHGLARKTIYLKEEKRKILTKEK